MSDNWNAIRQSLKSIKASAAVLLCACLFGFIEYLMWGRTHWEEGAFLLALLFLGAYDQLCRPQQSSPTARSRITSWILLILAGAIMLLSSRLPAEKLDMKIGRAHV